mmetsp:Transcript_23889/g.66761  ORF Transcript_23889/g.66761 Transcript_23889/m.66761 type:complete len:165 (-) Transcript_23889:439-933(-)
MKLSTLSCIAAIASSASAFQVAMPSATRAVTTLGMFGGAGAGAPKEDDAAEREQTEKNAKAMGMSVEEYQVAMNARQELSRTMDETRVSGGNKDKVAVERDLNNPPKTLEITITQAGKDQGAEALSKDLVKALKTASEASKTGRAEAQKQMMSYIQGQIKDGSA